jgi:hypothetical protein
VLPSPASNPWDLRPPVIRPHRFVCAPDGAEHSTRIGERLWSEWRQSAMACIVDHIIDAERTTAARQRLQATIYAVLLLWWLLIIIIRDDRAPVWKKVTGW